MSEWRRVWVTRTLAVALHLLGAGAASAQTTDYQGTVVNSQVTASPAALIVSFTSTAAPFAGYITIGAPLGGSGSFVGWRVKDTLFLRSISSAGDTILWVSPVIGSYIGGTYSVTGGQYRLQHGIWSAQYANPGPATVGSAQAVPVAIEVVDQSEGSVGQRFVFLVREQFRRSPAFRLTDASESRIQVVVSTMPRFSDNPNSATIYAVVWNFVLPDGNGGFNTLYYSSILGYAGTDVVEQSAQTIAARTDRLISDLRRAMASHE